MSGVRLAALAGIAVGVGLAGTGVVWARRRLVAVVIAGASMRPAYQPGDRVLVRRRGRRPVRRGDVVVLRVRQRAGPDRLAGGPWLIKRAAAVPGDPNPVAGTAHVPGGSSPTVPDGWLAVLGDNATASTDSRQFGLVHEDDVLGTVLRRLPGSGPLSRADRRSADPGLAFRGS